MYEQGFDVPALQPDLVLLNYTRPNNADLIKHYKRAGILVGVLDTEGIGGNNADQFAALSKGVYRSGRSLRLGCATGCLLKHGPYPRISCMRPAVRDTTLYRLGAALSKPSVGANYVLINTNFPSVNPRFSNGPADEQEAMVNAGFTREYANQVVIEAKHAYRSTLEMSMKLARHFPDVHFVLRPHPFENIKSYDALADYPNFEVRQEGTSIEWINGARLLIHQNCSTAIEATMLNVEPLSMEWFNTPSLRVQAAAQVSRPSHRIRPDCAGEEGVERQLPAGKPRNSAARSSEISLRHRRRKPIQLPTPYRNDRDGPRQSASGRELRPRPCSCHGPDRAWIQGKLGPAPPLWLGGDRASPSGKDVRSRHGRRRTRQDRRSFRGWPTIFRPQGRR
jgi:hypothetical protein